MTNDAHLESVRALYAAFGKGDSDAMLALLTEDVVFTLPEMPGVPLQASYQGKDGILSFLRDREPLLRYEAFDPRRFFSDQDTVIVLGSTRGIVLSGPAPFQYQWVQLFEFDGGGLISRFHEFLDTHVLVSAFRASPVDKGSGQRNQ
jgi:hypothetical protein